MLAAVEQDLAGEPIVVIGVHAPKFPGEGDVEAVRRALRHHGVTHPVVVDTGHRIWDDYTVTSWPTLVFIGPDGVIVGQASGEPEHLSLTATLRGIIGNTAVRPGGAPLPLQPQQDSDTELSSPGGLAVGEDRLWVADTGHHQIVECTLDGSVVRRIGRGRATLLDGAAETAGFHHPRGLAVAGDTLLVADTGNHAVRAISVATGAVSTLAGTGRRGRDPAAGPARRIDLRSPWDIVALPGGAVVWTMAGSHQLWGLQDGIAAPYAGSGREARVDGNLATAAFAQPSGVCTAPRHGAAAGDAPVLYVADSENSAIRAVEDEQVRTLAGGNLFTWGAQDGMGDGARFQHPLGVAWDTDHLIVADTLNHALRLSTPAGEVRTLATDVGLTGPEAVAVCEPGVLLVADTGAHRILRVDVRTGSCDVVLGGGAQDIRGR